MTEIEKAKRWAFIILMAGIAAAIVFGFGNRGRQQTSVAMPIRSQNPMPLESPGAEIHTAETADQSAAHAAAQQHAKDRARYLNSGFSRKSGVKELAIVAVGADGRLNDAVSAALVSKFHSDEVAAVPNLFTPEFVADGLFQETFDGSRTVFQRLDLTNAVDALLLARQTVRFTTNTDLNNVLTAAMRLQVAAAWPNPGGGEAWTFVATGAGFKPEDAYALAEERLLKQLAAVTNMSIK